MYRILGIILFTVLEASGIIGWKVDISLGMAALGIVILLVGFLTEHFTAFKVLTALPLPEKKLVGISASETVIWIIWLPIANFNPLLGLLFFVAAMFFQHSVEKNIFAGKPLFESLIKKEIIAFTVVEAGGATLFNVLFNQDYVLLANTALFVTLLIEHFIQAES